MATGSKTPSAKYRYLRDPQDGEVFELEVVDKSETQHGRTHRAKSQKRFWDGSEEQFRAQFDKL